MQDKNISAILLQEFDTQQPLFEGFAEACERLVKQILDANHVRVHSVTSRVKKRANLQEKLGRLGKDYQSLDEVTDLVGVRIITHFEDEVDRIATIIESEFAIDRNKSVDKRIILDPDRFGYLSIHYICTLSEARARLVEYKQFKEKICEIQIRSILQHAWAEIEHDLGYKSGSVVPAPIRRRFSRLAGLLELADIEFMQIRETLSSYAGEVEKALTEPFAEINLDDVSLQAFIQSDGTVRDLDQAMAEHVRAILVDPGNVQRLLEELRFVGLQTISDLRNALQANKNLVLDQFKKRLRDETHDHLVRGISLFHLFQVLLVQQGGRQKLLEAFEHFTIGPPGQRLDSAVDEIEAVVLGHMHNP
jgi:ppGpp synthetase/RelA/SpoT-type nucleotidyltranferase